MKKYFFVLLVSIFFISCSSEADKIVEMCIDFSGANQFEGKKISFDFRNRAYVAAFKDGVFNYERITVEPNGVIKDVLSNNGFKRYKDDILVEVHDTMATKYSNSVNSVHYFAYLPHGLNEKSVNKELLGEVTIKGKDYYKIKVWFDKKGGGVDYKDVFVYWINKKNYFVDYLAYLYYTDGGGIRFRESYNDRFVDGIRFVDYNNFKPADSTVTLFETDAMFEKNKLELVSKIELKNVKVEDF